MNSHFLITMYFQSDILEAKTCMCVKENADGGGGMFARVCGTCRLGFKFVCDDWKNKQMGMPRRRPPAGAPPRARPARDAHPQLPTNNQSKLSIRQSLYCKCRYSKRIWTITITGSI